MTASRRRTRIALASTILLVPLVGSSTPADAAGEAQVRVATAAESTGLVTVRAALTGGRARAGSGMLVTRHGLVVTNFHVVRGATALRVTDVTTGRTRTAQLVGYDPAQDIAVLRIRKASRLRPVTLAADAAMRGEPVVAVGDAGGDGGSLTAASGTVVDTRRSVDVVHASGRRSTLRDLVEMTAPVSPGDSGGAVLDASGAVVAMIVGTSADGIDADGFAIPAARVEGVVAGVKAILRARAARG